jgi:hypothetical protein
MADDFAAVFSSLKPVFSDVAQHLVLKTDAATLYEFVTRTPSPFPQHKGQPMYFGGVRLGKAYVSVYLMPLYMCPPLQRTISPALKKRMQGKTCFNFKAVPDPELLAELQRLAAAGFERWVESKWV